MDNHNVDGYNTGKQKRLDNVPKEPESPRRGKPMSPLIEKHVKLIEGNCMLKTVDLPAAKDRHKLRPDESRDPRLRVPKYLPTHRHLSLIHI